MLSEENRKICRLFAELLDYPDSSLPLEATMLARQLAHFPPDVTGPVQLFAAFVGSHSVEALEELYTQTFDVSPATTLYVGYHLFGETPKRSVFMVRLQEAYEACGYSSDTELADHLGVILRFLSTAEDAEFVYPLLEECLLPVLSKVEKELKKTDSAYVLAIGPVRAFLKQISRETVKTGGVFDV